MRFYPKDDLNKDPSNWWGPNIICLKEMLKTAGFKKAKKFSWNKSIIKIEKIFRQEIKKRLKAKDTR